MTTKRILHVVACSESEAEQAVTQTDWGRGIRLIWVGAFRRLDVIGLDGPECLFECDALFRVQA